MIRRLSTGVPRRLQDQWNVVIHSTKTKPQLPLRLMYAVKDNIATGGEATLCGLQMLDNYQSPFDATVVDLLNKEGFQSIGKVNLDEFGMGSAATNLWYGPSVNPVYQDEPHVCGGSSGGSAAAVAANLCDFSLGTDTGGSVRLPAAYCRVYGFKPLYGRILRWGVVAYAQTLDTVGIMARDIDTVERVFDIVDKYDESDPTSLPNTLRDQSVEQPKKYVIGVPLEFNVDELCTEVKQEWIEALEYLESQGHEVVPVLVPLIKLLLPAYYTIATAEAASNLSRYDGVRYGFSGGAGDFATTLQRLRDLLGDEVQRRIILGNYTLSLALGDHYKKANEVRRTLADQFNRVFSKKHCLLDNDNCGRCDALLYPAAFGPPPTINEFEAETRENFVNGYVNDIMTVPASLAGLPTITVPRGLGLQVLAQYNCDATALAVARLL